MQYLKKPKRQKSKKHKPHTKQEELAEINKARRQCGIPEIKTEDRECLKCDKVFTAYLGSGNFLCEQCGAKNIGDDNFYY